MTANDGSYAFMDMPTGGAYSVIPYNNNEPDLGVSTLDLILIQRHILGLQTFDNPDQYVAADINNSGSISGLDVVQLRKMVLGKIDEFPDNTSWRMMDVRDEFSSPEQALFGFHESKEIPVFNSDIRANFYGIKVGDVNGSAILSSNRRFAESRSLKWLNTEIVDDQYLEVKAEDQMPDLKGLQMSLSIDAEVLAIESEVLDITAQNYFINDEGILFISWHNLDGVDIQLDEVLFTVITSSKVNSVKVTEDVIAEAYINNDLEVLNLHVRGLKHVGDLVLFQNKPNPWSDNTIINFGVIRESNVTLTVYDVAGKEMLRRQKFCYPGINKFELERNDLSSSGVFYYTIYDGQTTVTKKMIVVR
jgi:hypothetical protein